MFVGYKLPLTGEINGACGKMRRDCVLWPDNLYIALILPANKTAQLFSPSFVYV